MRIIIGHFNDNLIVANHLQYSSLRHTSLFSHFLDPHFITTIKVNNIFPLSSD